MKHFEAFFDMQRKSTSALLLKKVWQLLRHTRLSESPSSFRPSTLATLLGASFGTTRASQVGQFQAREEDLHARRSEPA